MAERRLKLRLGLFVAGTLLALSALVVLFGAAPEMFSNKAKYAILFPEAPGIGPGTPIRKSGVRIGEVTAVDLDPDTGQVRVVIAVNRKFLPRTSEEAHISKGILSGDTSVDFLPKLQSDGQPVPRGDDYPPGTAFPGVPPVTPRSLLSQASGAIPDAKQSIDKVVATFERIEKAVPRAEKALDEISMLAKDARTFIPELKKTTDSIQKFIGGPPPELPPGAVGFQPDPPPNSLQALIRDAQATLAEIRGTVKRVDPELTAAVKAARSALDGANEVLSPENRKEVAALLKNLNALGLNVARLSGGFNKILDEIESTVKNFDRRTALTADVLADVRKFTKPLGERSDVIVRNVGESAEQLGKAVAEIRVAVQQFSRQDGSLQKLLSDPQLYQDLDAAAVSLARVMGRAEKIAKDLEVFADKVARRPELIGVGGAVRPSSGLKDLPNSPAATYRPDIPPAVPSYRPAPGWLGEPKSPPPIQGYPPRP